MQADWCMTGSFGLAGPVVVRFDTFPGPFFQSQWIYKRSLVMYLADL